jgi:hypothetical protein
MAVLVILLLILSVFSGILIHIWQAIRTEVLEDLSKSCACRLTVLLTHGARPFDWGFVLLKTISLTFAPINPGLRLPIYLADLSHTLAG